MHNIITRYPTEHNNKVHSQLTSTTSNKTITSNEFINYVAKQAKMKPKHRLKGNMDHIFHNSIHQIHMRVKYLAH